MKMIRRMISTAAALCLAAITAFSVSAAQNYISYAGYVFSLDNKQATIHAYEGDEDELYIPETLWNYTVVGIEDYAFMNRSDLKTLYLQYGTKLTTIGKFAFYGCSSFRYAEVPPMVETIGEGAFQDCSGLEKVVFDNQKITAIENQTFYGCSSLTAIELPGSVVSIGDLAFADCDSLQRIIIPAGVTAIGDSAFARSDALVIYCYKGSYAHRYATEKSIPFVLLDSGAEGYLLGDTDDNGDVDVVDATWLQRYVALMDVGVIEETVMHGDVDGDGDPTIVDATFIMRYCVGIVTPYGIGEPV